MVKFFETSSLFKYTWEQVATGLWQRYPNPNSKHVLTEDVISRHIEGDKLISKRMLTKTNKIPHWADRFVGKDSHILIIEESVIDLAERTVITYTRNIRKADVMSVIEKCVYRVNPENSSWTSLERSAWISSKLGYGVRRVIELFGIKRYKSNAEKATQGFDYILTSLFKPESLKDHPLIPALTIKEKARKAAELAKSKRPAMMAQTSS